MSHAVDSAVRVITGPGAQFQLWICPECDHHGIETKRGGVGPWPGDGNIRCPSRVCEYRTIMRHRGTLTLELSDEGLADYHGAIREAVTR